MGLQPYTMVRQLKGQDFSDQTARVPTADKLELQKKKSFQCTSCFKQDTPSFLTFQNVLLNLTVLVLTVLWKAETPETGQPLQRQPLHF